MQYDAFCIVNKQICAVYVALRPISTQPFAHTLPKLPFGPPLTSSIPKGLPYFAKWYPSRLQFHILSGRSISFPQQGVIVPCHLEFHRHYHSTISVPTISPAKAGILVRESPQRSKFPFWWDIAVKMQVCACEIFEFQPNDISNNVMTARVSGPYLVI